MCPLLQYFVTLFKFIGIFLRKASLEKFSYPPHLIYFNFVGFLGDDKGLERQLKQEKYAEIEPESGDELHRGAVTFLEHLDPGRFS